MSDDAIAKCILTLTAARGPSKSVCPSEVARSLTRDEQTWRSLMMDVRRVAGELVAQGRIIATQRGSSVDPRTARGAIRLAIKLSAE